MKKQILYFCSFVPHRFLSENGFEMVSAYDLIESDGMKPVLSGNLCNFVKNCELIDFTRFDGVIFINCCNSMQRLYDYVSYRYPEVYAIILNLPHEFYCKNYFTPLFESLSLRFHTQLQERNPLPEEINPEEDKEKILVLTSTIHKIYFQQLQTIFKGYELQLESCWSIPRGDRLLAGEKSVTCPRMLDYGNYLKGKIQSADMVIFITLQRCDHIMFTYPIVNEICKSHHRKLLLVEEEYRETIPAHSRIRYDAFLECIELERKAGERRL